MIMLIWFMTLRGASFMEIHFLADHPEWIHIIAFMHQLEMRKPNERNFDRSIQQFSQRANRQFLPIAYVAVEDTVPVGSVTLLEDQLPTYSNHKLWVASLFVLEQYRGRGIGDALMRKAELSAVSLGYNTILLFTHTAQSYYEKRGWEIIDTVDPPDVSYASVVMSKQLLKRGCSRE
jgi:predicted N-acetyltransferase YhbS